ncbi:MAG: phage virion morphogenesis protein [Rikenellaceae bacterium]
MSSSFKKEVIDRSLKDIKVELDKEFKQNFVRKSFFDEQKWPGAKFPNTKGSLMLRGGELRRSIRSKLSRGELVYESSKPYARIHNEGGVIPVTTKMRRFFWFKHYESLSGVVLRIKDRSHANKRSEQMNKEAEFWLKMTHAKKITIPKRQFIGEAKATNKIIREIAEKNIEDYFNKSELLKNELLKLK